MSGSISPPKGPPLHQNPVAAAHSSYSSGIWANGEVILQCSNIVYLDIKMCDPISHPKDVPFYQNPLRAAHSPYSSSI